MVIRHAEFRSESGAVDGTGYQRFGLQLGRVAAEPASSTAPTLIVSHGHCVAVSRVDPPSPTQPTTHPRIYARTHGPDALGVLCGRVKS